MAARHDLNLYKRLAAAKRGEAIDTLPKQITDRVGKLLVQGQTLFEARRLLLLAKPRGMQQVDAWPNRLSLTFRFKPPADSMANIARAQKSRHFRRAVHRARSCRAGGIARSSCASSFARQGRPRPRR